MPRASARGSRALPFLFLVLFCAVASAQVENVPVSNQVYEFLDRMGVKGILPLYSNSMIPLSRKDVANLLMKIDVQRLGGSDREYLAKFRREFIHEIDPAAEDAAVLTRGSSIADFASDKEKYLYVDNDSTVSVYVDLLGSVEYRRGSGDSSGSRHVTLEEHGGRIRGTIKNRLGYFIEGTDGTAFGDKEFALSDPRLGSNYKLRMAGSTNFDFTQAYLRADLSWFNLELGRERVIVGTGGSDRLLLSGNAPAFDLIKIDAQVKSFRFIFVHGSLVDDSLMSPGGAVTQLENKYLALHRFQLSLFDRLNLGVSEMTVYRRTSPDLAYLNPINFYKSAEHSLRDRDNSFLNFDLELFPADSWKFYGTWLIDDIDFSKIGTGWWGNEFGWQGGAAFAPACPALEAFDAVLQYTRLEPYVYSHRLPGSDYTNSSVILGSRLNPNSDEWLVRLGYHPTSRLRSSLTYAAMRHGENVRLADGTIRNVGGDAMFGHRDGDAETAKFLDGNLVRTDGIQFRVIFEPITDLFLSGAFEFRRTNTSSTDDAAIDRFGSVQVRLGTWQ